MNISPRQLHVFVTLANALSFHKAAAQLHITQPTLSKLIKNIEETIGVRLFERDTRHVNLSRDGQALLKIAQKTVIDFQEGMNEFEQIVRHRNQRLSIAALPTLAASLLPELIMNLRNTHPEANIKVFDVITKEAMQLLYSKKVDMVLSAKENTPHSLRFTKIFIEPFVLMHKKDTHIPFTHWDAGKLSELSIISMPQSTSTRLVVDHFFIQNGHTFSPAFALRDLHTISRFVLAGCGIALLPLSAAEPFVVDQLSITKLDNAPCRTIGIFTLKDDELSPLALEVIRALSIEAAVRNK